MYRDFMVAFGIDVLAERRQKPGDVGRTAGAVEPAGTVRFVIRIIGRNFVSVHLERVDIEKAPAIGGDTAEDAVVKGPLQFIRLAAVAMDLQKPMVPEN